METARFDFDKEVDRRGTASLKWDVKPSELPMWVADMDFETAPCVREAIEKRAAHGVFGYNVVSEEWYEAYQEWWEGRHHFEIDKDWLIFCTGVVPAISSIVRKVTTVGEKVVLLTPVYNIFFNSIINNGRYIKECPLLYHPALGKDMEDGAKDPGQVRKTGDAEYEIDFAALEEALSDPQVTLFIFCNPHNPVGKLWKREELARVGELCKKYHVLLLSDEIHCDLTDPGKGYIPFASVSETCRDVSITCIAPTKAFNLAGMQTAAVMVPDPVLRHKVWRGLNTDEVAEPNSFAVTVTIAAFREGGPWLDSLRKYLYENKKLVLSYIKEKLPKLHVVFSEATYLLWINISRYSNDGVELTEFLRKETGLYVSEGAEYGEAGREFFRLNIACPRTRLLEGLERLRAGLLQYDSSVKNDH